MGDSLSSLVVLPVRAFGVFRLDGLGGLLLLVRLVPFAFALAVLEALVFGTFVRRDLGELLLREVGALRVLV